MQNLLKARDKNYDFIFGAIGPEEDKLSHLFAKYEDLLDWDWLLKVSQKQKIAGIFLDKLERLGIEHYLTTKIQSRLNLMKAQNKDKSARAYLTLKQLARAFTQNQIPFLALKGSIFAEELYGDHTIRPFHDVDLLVPVHLLKEAEDVIVNLGYSFYAPFKRLPFVPLGRFPKSYLTPSSRKQVARQLYERYHCHFPFVVAREDKRFPVDLHWHILPPGVLKIDSKSIWKHVREHSFHDFSVKTLSIEANLVYLAGRIAVIDRNYLKLLPLSDFIRLLFMHNDKCNIRLVWKIAEEWGAARYLTFCLKLTKKLVNYDASPVLNNPIKTDIGGSGLLNLIANKAFINGLSSKSYDIRHHLASFLWELAMGRLPRSSTRGLILGLNRFCQKMHLLRSPFN